MGFREVIASLLGIPAYQQAANSQAALYPQLGDGVVDEIREAVGGNIQPQLTTRLRWYLADLEAAQIAADSGNMRPCAQLYRAMRRDGVIAGLLGTRSGGLIRLPNTFYGDEGIASELSSKKGAGASMGSRSVFAEMVPPSELETLNNDGIMLGIGVGELVPVPGRKYPVFVRLDPEYLVYRWNQNRWYFQSVAGLIPIEPGNGRWVLHVPGSRMSPWLWGLWPAVGRAYINKDHALLHRSNYSKTLANPARLAYAPLAATEAQRIGFFKKLLAWGINTVVELPPGYEAKLLESNGRGWDVFQEEVKTSDNEIMVAIAGQVVTTTGGTGFANADVHKTIREDLIKRDAEGLAYTVNTQIIPQYIARTYGVAAMSNRAVVIEWDTSTPKELKDQAQTLQQLAQACALLRQLTAGSNREINWDELFTRFAVPYRSLDQAPAQMAALPAAAPDSSAPTPEGAAAAERVLSEAA